MSMVITEDWQSGTGARVFRRDKWHCAYCSVDGTKSMGEWLLLTIDHLLPRGTRNRDDEDFTVTACSCCNMLLNSYYSGKDIAIFEAMTPKELVAARLLAIRERREQYTDYWRTYVRDQT